MACFCSRHTAPAAACSWAGPHLIHVHRHHLLSTAPNPLTPTRTTRWHSRRPGCACPGPPTRGARRAAGHHGRKLPSPDATRARCLNTDVGLGLYLSLADGGAHHIEQMAFNVMPVRGARGRGGVRGMHVVTLSSCTKGTGWQPLVQKPGFQNWFGPFVIHLRFVYLQFFFFFCKM